MENKGFKMISKHMRSTLKKINSVDWSKVDKDARGHPIKIFNETIEFSKLITMTKIESLAFEINTKTVRKELNKKGMI